MHNSIFHDMCDLKTFGISFLPTLKVCNMSHAKSKSKPDNSKPKSLPLSTPKCMLKNNPDIFALCETNLHDDIQDTDFQLPGYLPIHSKGGGHIQGPCVYVNSNLPIAGETIFEDENKSVFSFGFSTFYYLLLPSSNIGTYSPTLF